MSKKILIFKNDRGGDLVSSIRLIYKLNKNNNNLTIYLSDINYDFNFLLGKLKIKKVNFNLNLIDYEPSFELSSLIKLKDIPGILTKYNDIFNRGFDDVNFLTGLSRHLREVLICKLGSSDKISDLKNELELKYLEHSKDFLDEDLILMIQIINECLINYQKINDKRIHTELCLMRVASIDSIKKKNP